MLFNEVEYGQNQWGGRQSEKAMHQILAKSFLVAPCLASNDDEQDNLSLKRQNKRIAGIIEHMYIIQR